MGTKAGYRTLRGSRPCAGRLSRGERRLPAAPSQQPVAAGMANAIWRDRQGADEVTPGLSTEIAKELRHLEGAWPSQLPQGVIHADLFPDNVFFLGNKVSGLIDFYFACTDALAYDVAICLNAWCFEIDHSYNVTKGRALLQAYAAVRPLPEQER